MANVAPPGPDDSIAKQLLIPCGILQVVVVVLYVARMYARLHPIPKLWWDDYTISLATVSDAWLNLKNINGINDC